MTLESSAVDLQVKEPSQVAPLDSIEQQSGDITPFIHIVPLCSSPPRATHARQHEKFEVEKQAEKQEAGRNFIY